MVIEVILVLALATTAHGCGELSGSSGTFSSRNYPQNYPNNDNCVWTMNTGSEQVTITFLAFDIESETDCGYDKLEIKQGNTVLGNLCGTDIPSPIIASGSVTITFTSDGSVQKSGFSASYSIGNAVTPTGAPSTPAPTGCGGDFNAESGTISSPNYPSNYDNNLDCAYTVTIPNGNVALTFEDFDVESAATCNYDYLEVRDRDSTGTLLAKLCGASTPSPVFATGKSIYLRFKTDTSVQSKGWSLKYERETCAGRGYSCVTECVGTVKTAYCPQAGAICCAKSIQSAEGCGVVPKRTRIVGGNEATAHTWPWQASLQTTSSSFHFCGATLINENWVVTAAHCVDGDTPDKLKVILGEHHVTEDQEAGGVVVTKTVNRIIMHESYNGNGNGFPNDVALLKFDTPVTFTDEIVPACFPEADQDFAGSSDCWITGWGNTQGTGESVVLNELNIEVLSNTVCSNKWGSSYINNGHVCLGNGLSGACNGDSGGPLACNVNGTWVVAGATSWGRTGCQTEGYPSVYSRITFFLDWIKEKLEANN